MPAGTLWPRLCKDDMPLGLATGGGAEPEEAYIPNTVKHKSTEARSSISSRPKTAIPDSTLCFLKELVRMVKEQ